LSAILISANLTQCDVNNLSLFGTSLKRTNINLHRKRI